VRWTLKQGRTRMAPFDDGAIVFDTLTGQTHHLNTAYSALLHTLMQMGSCTEAQLGQEVFGAPPAEELAGIHQAMEELARMGFVESVIATSVES